MIKRQWQVVTVLCLCAVVLVQCNDFLDRNRPEISDPTSFELLVPEKFPGYLLNVENPLTVEGIVLGKKLFFDPILSKNQNISCGSCHLQSDGFSDNRTKSIGTNGEKTQFHSMPLVNMAWMSDFFWNGRAKSREEQALKPVTNPLEMDMSWPEAQIRLQLHPDYPTLFERAFGTRIIDSTLVARALVQFEMTLISSDSKYDRFRRGEASLTLQEEWGFSIYTSEIGDCFHCHNDNGLTTDNGFHNTGLDNDENLQPGLFEVTGDLNDFGKFKTPTLRNLAFTAPYMHDGRFETLDEVINFYSEGLHDNATVDGLMKKVKQGGLQLQNDQKEALKAFLLTMTDSTILTNTYYSPL